MKKSPTPYWTLSDISRTHKQHIEQKNKKNLYASFLAIKHLIVQIKMTPNIQNLAPSYIAHCTGNFFSFSKHPLQVKFRSSVQILWKLLVCIEGVDSLQTKDFH